MNQKLFYSLLFLWLITSVFLPKSTWAKNVEQEIKATGVLKVGLREDSPLFGFGSKKEGYCADFAQELANNLSLKLNQPIEVELITSNHLNRWDLVTEGIVHFECGPNTISKLREAEYNVKFSKPFFVTATQIFINSGISDTTIRNGTIGYLEGTTTEAELKSVYPQEQLNNYVSSRKEGVLAVAKGEIVGFASDGILLIGTATSLDMSPENFALVTPVKDDRPFCAAYGMILPEGEENANWRNTLNNLIAKNGQGAAIWDNWFLSLLPYLASVLQSCQ